MKRTAILILSLLCGVLTLRAQVATVEVSRPYDVNLDGIRKPAIPTSVDDSLHRFDVHFDYSIFNRPYGDLYDFTPYESIQLSTVGANRTPYVSSRNPRTASAPASTAATIPSSATWDADSTFPLCCRRPGCRIRWAATLPTIGLPAR